MTASRRASAQAQGRRAAPEKRSGLSPALTWDIWDTERDMTADGDGDPQ